MKKIDLKSATLVSLMGYLEELDYEASILNKSTEELLERAKLDKKFPKEIFTILNNTLQAMKKGEITCNGSEVQPFEHSDEINDYKQFAIDVDKAVKVKTPKELGKMLDDMTDWDVVNHNERGAVLNSDSDNADKDSFSFNVKTGTISLYNSISQLWDGQTYTLGKDFTHILHQYDDGIYLLNEVAGHLEGVWKIRW